ncbi:MAG: hypothetical protein GWP10_19045 [Nitrospiraceae bacterium]|nr:hypothetical protein [Nitrospiraceae bacterium]
MAEKEGAFGDLLDDTEPQTDERCQIVDGKMIWTAGDTSIVCRYDKKIQEWEYNVIKSGVPITTVIKSKKAPYEEDSRGRDSKMRRLLKNRDDVDDDVDIGSAMDEFGIYLMQHPDVVESYDETISSKKMQIEVQVSEEVSERAMKLLCDSHLIEILDEAIKERLVGETKNAFFTFFVILSAKVDEPLDHRLNGDSSTGKTAIVVSVVRLFPPEMIIIRAGMTAKVFYYDHSEEDASGERVNDLTGKALILLEEEESQEFLREIKPILSHDMHELVYSFVDKVNNRNQTRKAIIRGYPSYVGLTTQVVTDEQLSTRTTTGTPEYKPEKFEAIIDQVASDAVAPWARTKDTARLETIRQAIRVLKHVKVVVPYMGAVREHYQHHAPRAVRDFKQYRAIIETVACLHQYQRQHIEIDGVEYVIANIFDLDVAARITESIVCETASGLPKDVLELYNSMVKDGSEPYTKKTLLSLYRKIFGKDIGRTRLTDRYIDPLVEKGLLDIDTTEKEHKFSIVEKDLSLSVVTDKMIANICSDSTKAQIKRDYMSRWQTDKEGVRLSEETVDTLINSALSARQRNIPEKIFERCFADEYPRKYSSDVTTDNDRSLSENKTQEDVNEDGESDGTQIMRLIVEHVKKYGREDDHTFNVIAAKIEEESFDTKQIEYCITKYREGHRIYIPLDASA